MIKKSIKLLGLRATDKVTGFEGVISSICFDLYGCVQVALTPPSNGSGKLENGHWFDISRLEVSAGERVMNVPKFEAIAREPSDFTHGPAEKPHKTI